MRYYAAAIALFGILIPIPAISQDSSTSSEPYSPNVLFIAIDDLKTIGTLYADEPGSFLRHIYPDQKLRSDVAQRMTPNLQRLADRGVRFMDAYCAAPSCNPSRAALMTGIRPHLSGLTTNAGGVFFRDYQYEGEKPLKDAITIAQLLKDNGWFTGATGKIFHTSTSFAKSDGNRSWTSWVNVKGRAGQLARGKFSPKSLDWGQEGDDNATHIELNDYRRADFVAKVLEHDKASFEETTFELPSDKPFFLACGIFRPHLPFYATRDLLDLFPTEEMAVTKELLHYFRDDAGDLPEEAYKWSGMSVKNGMPAIGSDRFVDILKHGKKLQPNEGDLMGWKRMLQHYFACCAIADRSVGRLLDGLDAGKHSKNTMIILWSDHGYHLGEKLHETKFTLWDAGANVNLLISDPRHPGSAGKRCDHPVTLTDLFPTIARLAGLKSGDPRVQGSDLEPLLANPKGAWATPAQSTHGNTTNHMIRTRQYKLIRYGNNNQRIELYNMEADPEEYNNLAEAPQLQSTKSMLIKMLDSAIDR
jgi:arylsulfatase A-like enzyme